jgi:hypothetical protein
MHRRHDARQHGLQLLHVFQLSLSNLEKYFVFIFEYRKRTVRFTVSHSG